MEAANSSDEKLVLLTTVYNEVEGNLIKSLLDDVGIDCLLVTHVPHSVYPLTINGLAEIKIKVLESDLAAAREALDASQSTSLPPE